VVEVEAHAIGPTGLGDMGENPPHAFLAPELLQRERSPRHAPCGHLRLKLERPPAPLHVEVRSLS
jgi:hypothetical protein